MEGAGSHRGWSLAPCPAWGVKLVWAESTIGNWIVITAWLPGAIGALSLSVSSQYWWWEGGDLIANPRWEAEGGAADGQILFPASPPLSSLPNNVGCLSVKFTSRSKSFVEVIWGGLRQAG